MSELDRSRKDGVGERPPCGRSGEFVLEPIMRLWPLTCDSVFSLDDALIKGFRAVKGGGDSMRGAGVDGWIESG